MQDSYDNECIAILEIFLNCSFESMNVEDIGNFQLRNSPGSRLLWECSLSTLQKTPRAALDCFLKARQACLRHPVKLVKSVRFRGQAVAQMMARNRDLKVLYLVRDPRGTISSQNIAFWKLVTDETLNYTRKFCQMFREDLAAIQPLFDRYPDRIKLVRYETLAEKPLLVSEELYGFLGLSFTSDVREFVFNSTSAGHKSTYNFATDRANSTSAAYAWRRRIHFPVVQATDQFCADVYRKLGYLPLRSEAELTDFRYKVKTDATFHGVAI
nr:hypothetical protein BaRGS_017779 [Batillaria attramentaria]